MWRPILYCMVLVLPALCLQAQQEPPPRISPLFNYLTSNSSLHRSPTFRNMQEDINTRLKNVNPGLRVDYFFDKMSAVHKALGQRLQVQIDSVAAKKTLQVVLINDSKDDTVRKILFTQELNDISLDSLYNRAMSEWKGYLRIELTKAFEAIQDTAVRKVIAEQIRNLLPTVGVPLDNLPLINTTTSSIIAESIVNNYFQALAAWLKSDLEERIDNKIWNSTIITTSKPIVSLINNFLDQLHSNLAGILNRAENTLTQAVQEASTWLISGNTGIGIERGAGNFSGGLHLSLNVSKKLQIGAYVNSNFTADSSQPGRWLVGLQGRFFICKEIQLDALLSSIVGNHRNFKDWDICEAGASIQTTCLSFPLGIAGFSRFIVRDWSFRSNTISAGLFFKSLSPRAPTFLIGGIGSGDYCSPFFKIIYPITGQQ